MAQGNGLFVTITRFEPQVNGDTVAYVTVVDEQGLPVAGLTKDDFSILEDEQLNLSDKVNVESTNDTELRLVLALDVSMPPPEVATMKEAAIRYIQSLQAKDQVALFVFFDETKLVQDFTEDKAKLVSLVQALQPEGDFTTLHETVFNATTKASQFPVGRRAVIVVTNSGNNINAPYTADETIKHAQELQVPLYVIALQTLNRLTEFQDVAQLTGGQSYILKDAGEVAESLADIDKRLRPAYKLTYPSQIAPDNQEHAVSFGVKYKGATGVETGQALSLPFVAVLDQIDVKIIGVNEGQTVTGLVNLMAEVTAPTKGVKVQYCLDNKVLGEATEPPYIFEWNTHQSRPGSTVLCAKAIDAAGHIGEAKLNVRVPMPIAVTIATDPRQQASLGQVITVEAKVVALSDVAKVDFLVNGDTVGSDKSAPYQLIWKGTQTGTFTLTARAEDVLGGKNEDSTSMNLLASPLNQGGERGVGWWQRFLKWIRAPYSLIGWIACMTLLFLLLLIPFMLLLARYLRNKGRRLAHVELTNLGNIISRYELRADDPDNALIFQF
ncbi:VWA domain-containing protein, partial [Shewanella sp.]|uniref:VWA domain-containing protein n=1 Tax=Shewanella sp. TaxID=50422 RepID=UPI003F679C77